MFRIYQMLEPRGSVNFPPGSDPSQEDKSMAQASHSLSCCALVSSITGPLPTATTSECRDGIDHRALMTAAHRTAREFRHYYASYRESLTEARKIEWRK